MKRLFLLTLIFLAFVTPALAENVRSFDGVDDQQTIVDPDVGAAGYTIMGWINDATFTAGDAIVAYGTGAAQGWAISEEAAGVVRFRAFAPGTEQNTYTVGEGAWHHFAAVKATSGANLKFYVDGAEVGSDSYDPHTPLSTDDFYIAVTLASDPASNTRGSFALAHLAYWNIDLNAGEVASIADKSTCPTAVQAANLQIFIPEVDDDVDDASANTFTVVEAGTPGNATGPGGLPCGSGGGTGGSTGNGSKFNGGFN